MNSLIKKSIFYFLDSINIEYLYLNKINNNNSLTILSLHKVSPDKNPFYQPLSPDIFDSLLKYITKHFNIITFSEIEQFSKSARPNIILSFDDGYYDFKQYAMPILEKYGARANLNIIPSCVESGLPMWNIQVIDFLNSSTLEVINDIKISQFNGRLSGADAQSKTEYGLKLSKYLKSRPRDERDELVRDLFDKINSADIEYTRMLSADEVIEIAETHEIGVHSYSHESMGYETKAYFERDYQKCRDYFNDKLMLPLDIYAFPNGSYKKYQVDYLLEQGIKHILLVDERYSDYVSASKMRFTFYADSISEARVRSVGFRR